jgi:hypothetical protein
MRRQRATNSCACVKVIVIKVSKLPNSMIVTKSLYKGKAKRQSRLSGGYSDQLAPTRQAWSGTNLTGGMNFALARSV